MNIFLAPFNYITSLKRLRHGYQSILYVNPPTMAESSKFSISLLGAVASIVV